MIQFFLVPSCHRVIIPPSHRSIETNEEADMEAQEATAIIQNVRREAARNGEEASTVTSPDDALRDLMRKAVSHRTIIWSRYICYSI